MANQFDPLAQLYEDMAEWPLRREVEIPTVLGLLGDLSGGDVLDIGCGTGIYCRRVKERGAERVAGYDISEGMLAKAREREAEERRGIQYTGGEFPDAYRGAFDVAISVYVLPYARTYEELLALCRQAASSLRDGGRYLTLPIHPRLSVRREYYEPYGLRLYTDEPLADGAAVNLDLCLPPYQETVVARYWSAPTLERALRAAGFDTVVWAGHTVTAEGIARYGEDFWAPYLRCPHAAILDCRL
jgi:toxoflavin synthase